MCHVQYLLWQSTHIANEADYQWSHLTRSNNTTEQNVCYLLHSIKSLNTSHFNMDFKKQAFAFYWISILTSASVSQFWHVLSCKNGMLLFLYSPLRCRFFLSFFFFKIFHIVLLYVSPCFLYNKTIESC